ncbi:MAG: hydrogen peroxide-inducible genes activator [Pseudomonadota bacterium]
MFLPTIRQLQFLIALADESSFSRAAARCNVTQPTLSAAIKEVEKLLDVQLVEREARGASLTRAGEAAVERARKIIAEAEELVTVAEKAGAPLSGPFRLGAIPTIAPFVLPQITRQLRDTYPKLKLYLREDKTDALVEALRARTLDAAIIGLPWTLPGIEVESLLDDEFLFVASPEHALFSKRDLTTDDLANEDLLLLEDGHCMRDHALSVCAMPNGRDGAEVSATSLQTLIHMVAGDLGVSLLPKIAVDAGIADHADVEVRAFRTPVVGRAIGIAWRTGSSRAEEARLIGAAIKAALKS